MFISEYQEIADRESEAKGSAWSMQRADLVFQANAHADMRKLLGEVQRLRAYIDQNMSDEKLHAELNELREKVIATEPLGGTPK